MKKFSFNPIGKLTLVAGMAILLGASSCKCDKGTHKVDGAATAATGVAAAVGAVAGTFDSVAGKFKYDTGDLIDIKLADGTVFKAGKNSTEGQLYTQITDSAFKVSEDKTQNWISLTGTDFNSGDAVLSPTSKEQIDHIAGLLKAYPTATLKVGGYTDNTGTPEGNLKLSGERAKAVVAELVKGGITADRLSGEGYGQEHPVCAANDTPACQAQNRRVDVRLSAK